MPLRCPQVERGHFDPPPRVLEPADPPDPLIRFLLSSFPALLAAGLAAAGALVASIPHSRKAALRESLGASSRRALDRYLESPAVLEARWLVLRVFCVSLSAVLLARVVPELPAGVPGFSTALVVLALYAIPAQIGLAVARRRGDSLVPLVLRVLYPLELLALPLADPITRLSALIAKPVQPARAPSASLVETEMELLVSQNEQSGALDHDQSEMIRNVLDFGDLRAGDIKIPRVKVVALDEDETPRRVLELAASGGHSRYPVFHERSENVVGILHVKDLLEHVASHGVDDIELGKLMRTPVVYASEAQLASSLLADMRAGRHHMAVVVDEFGSMSGIATLEDVVEAIVGDIQNEDEEAPPIVDLGAGRLMVSASIPIAELNRYLGIELPEQDAYNSLGGFIIERLGHVPTVGTVLQDTGVDLIVRDADERKVDKVEVVTHAAAAADSLPPPSSSLPAA